MISAHPSLLRRIVIGQLLVVLAFCLLTITNLFWQFYKQDEGNFDHGLTWIAKSAQKILSTEVTDSVQIPQVAKGIDTYLLPNLSFDDAHKAESDSIRRSAIGIVLRVVSREGQELYRTPGYEQLPLDVRQLGLHDIKSNNRKWRAITLKADDQSYAVQVAQTTEIVESGIFDIIKTYIAMPLFAFLPIAAIVTWLVAARGLSPLRELADTIALRSPADLKPLKNIKPYAETEPVVNEINSLLHSLDVTLSRERNFLADAAHELRTPLAVIQAQAHVLRHAADEAQKSVAADELSIGIERAASLIQKLLLTARVSVVDFTPRFVAVDLTALMQERIAAFSALAAKKKIEMELHAHNHCSAKIDRETFLSAVDNVLDNAIRYTPEYGAIKVYVERLEASKVRLRVTDNGSGISSEFYERVFERFYRVAGNEQQGSGLGLAIVKRVIELHGGYVALSAGPGQRGLAVDLTLPLSV